jgi:hypothetical protein
VVWCHVGSEAPAATAMAPLIDALSEPLLHGVQSMPYPMLQSAFDGLHPKGDHWYWRAGFVMEIPDEAVEIHARFGTELPSIKSTMHMYPIDEAAHDIGNSDAAWSYRDARWAPCSQGSTLIQRTSRPFGTGARATRKRSTHTQPAARM